MLKESLVNEIEESIKRNWQLPALSDYKGKTLSYGEIASKIKWLHYIFSKNKIRQGDKIALLGKNSEGWATTYLATVTYGAVIVPILPDFHPDEIHHIINHSDSVLLFISDAMYEQIDTSRLTGIQSVFSMDDFSLLYTRHESMSGLVEKSCSDYLNEYDTDLSPETFCLQPIENDQLAAIVYTSGTTGFSKGVMLSHNCLTANIIFAQNALNLNPGDTIVSFLPLAHAFGCSFEFLYPLSRGCHITFLGKIPSPKVIVNAFQEIRPKLILSVPLVIEKIYKKHLRPFLNQKKIRVLLKIPGISNLIYSKINQKLSEIFGNNFETIVIGGAALDRELAEFLSKIHFRYTVGYGLSECGPLVSYSAWNIVRRFSVGRVMDTLEIKIDSENPRKIVGEILVRGENIMDGYYKDPDNTAEAIDQEGWFHTGDLGQIDEKGFIFIKGRSKHMILNSSGQNIYPEEIESKLNNMPFVEESLVIEKNGKLTGLIYPDYEAVNSKGLSENELQLKLEEIRNQLNKQLPVYSKISRIELFTEEFEKTPTKKIKRRLYQKSGSFFITSKSAVSMAGR